MILWLYRLFCGYLKVSLTGRKSGRFLNLCARHDMLLWNVASKEEDSYQFCMYLKDFRKVRPLCRKTGTRLRITKRCGLPFFLYRYRKRIWFPAAFMLVAGFILFCSGFVWKIEIVGNSYLSEDVIIQYLKTQNAGFGTPKSDIDCDALELSLRQDFPQVIWASSYIEGTKLVVEIQENLKKEEVFSEQDSTDPECEDLTASKDAVIASMITRNGTPYVKVGDTVAAGDILVSGRQEILDDSGEVKEYFYQTADADIMGYVTYVYEDTIPVTSAERVDTGNSHTVYFAEIFGKRLETPQFWKPFEQEYCIEDYHQIQLSGNFYLPVFFGEKQLIEQEIREHTYEKEEAKELAETHLKYFLEDLEENGVSIIDKNVMIEKIGNSYQVSGTIQACESIAQRTPTERIEIQKEGTESDEHE